MEGVGAGVAAKFDRVTAIGGRHCFCSSDSDTRLSSIRTFQQ